MKRTSAPDVEEYLSSLPPDQRKALTALRRTIRSAAPKATERISWGMPMFYHEGMLVAYGAFRKHCSLFVMSKTLLKQFPGIVERYGGATGTVHFTPEKPLPAGLVKKVVKARMKMNELKKKVRS